MSACTALQVQPPPSRLVATDGDEALIPLLRANVQANGREEAAEARCMMLRWNAGLPDKQNLSGAFDLVVASDAIFSTAPYPRRSSNPGGAFAPRLLATHLL